MTRTFPTTCSPTFRNTIPISFTYCPPMLASIDRVVGFLSKPTSAREDVLDKRQLADQLHADYHFRIRPMFALCSSYVRPMFVLCSLYVLPMFVLCWSYAALCSSYIRPMFVLCALLGMRFFFFRKLRQSYLFCGAICCMESSFIDITLFAFIQLKYVR